MTQPPEPTYYHSTTCILGHTSVIHTNTPPAPVHRCSIRQRTISLTQLTGSTCTVRSRGLASVQYSTAQYQYTVLHSLSTQYCTVSKLTYLPAYTHISPPASSGSCTQTSGARTRRSNLETSSVEHDQKLNMRRNPKTRSTPASRPRLTANRSIW